MGTNQNNMKKIKNALISVSDKKKLKNLLPILKKYNIKLISSGGTYKEIKKLKFSCIEVSKFTGSTEILDGRVKTLHPKIHAGILNKRNNKSHQKQLNDHHFENIDLVIVNFYPFEKILKNTTNHNKIIENIDVGGPAMVRAAAKNYNDVTVLTSINQYEQLINELITNRGSTSLNFRQKLSEQAFGETAYYDSIISNYFYKFSKNKFPKKRVFFGNLIQQLRYGENPHQDGAIYSENEKLDIEQIHGKKLSYNNYNDIFAALSLSKSLPKNVGTVIIKHANPCGVSINKNHKKSYQLALQCDPISAFGGVVACNYKVNKSLAIELNKIFLEVIIANGFENKAIKVLKKKKNLRIINSSNLILNEENKFSSMFNCMLTQTPDNNLFSKENFKIVSRKKPSSNMLKNLIFAFNVSRFVKSNSIVIANKDATIGIGSGQPSRLDSCKIAINKMKQFYKSDLNDEIIAASDAFFPFVDGVEKLVQTGVRAIIQPSGSIRDKEIIKFANQTNTVLVFSKTRHFRH